MFSNTHVLAAALGVFVAGFSSIATGVNFIATTHMLRAPGMTWFRLPLFVWAIYATSIVMVLATPVLAVTLLLVMAERWLGLPIFDPSKGGDPLLFQHLFWFYSHPAVYIMVLPAMGVISEVITCFARRRIFGYAFMVYALVSIASIGFFVWGHHMFVAGMSPYAGLVFSFLSFVVAVPSAIKVFNWTATLYRGQIGFEAPMLYALGFLGLFTIGGLTGLFLASIPVDVHVTDTYFVVAHFHYIMVGGTVSAYFAGLHFWWPKITGRMYPEVLGALRRDPDVLRLQLHLLPAVHRWVPRHAAALSRLSRRSSRSTTSVVVRGRRARRRLPPAARLPDVVADLGPAGRRQSLECDRTRVAHQFAAAPKEIS